MARPAMKMAEDWEAAETMEPATVCQLVASTCEVGNAGKKYQRE
jgi:hypothetical protein